MSLAKCMSNVEDSLTKTFTITRHQITPNSRIIGNIYCVY